ncbi:MAG: hypothetical protein HYY29_03400 [Chloroflexi bacterium]|nr:hypothetical protein [Chloroflexota bacterium]MBI4329721.1 hypothetical protein [Chloroflexota bacterium]
MSKLTAVLTMALVVLLVLPLQAIPATGSIPWKTPAQPATAMAAVPKAIPLLDPAGVRAAATAAGLASMVTVPVPQVTGIENFLNPGPGPKSMAVVMGKALFWDQQVGSDGQSCASCHFVAGADNRTKNQLNPGFKVNPPDSAFGNAAITGIAGFPRFAPNYNMVKDDLPSHQLVDDENRSFSFRGITRSTNDVVSSQGVFKANFTGTTPGQMKDNGVPVADNVYNVAGVNVRRVEPRNTPSVINAVHNVDNFLDGRAANKFNGKNPLGPLDDAARILVNVNGALTPTQVSIPNSSLASQAVGPPLSPEEMSFIGRTFPDIGKKMLAARPLAFQRVHQNDSVLGTFSRDGQALNGLTFAAYAELVQAVFQAKYWDSDRVITYNPDGTRVINPPGTPNGYTQMQDNFSLFFGLAIQAYESTLLSDRTRLDLFMEGDDSALDQDEMRGLLIFINAGQPNPIFAGLSKGSCTSCHKSTLFSDATFSGQGAEGVIEIELAPILKDGELVGGTELVLLDNGFYNIGVRPINEDLGRGGSENGKPLSKARQAIQGYPFAPPLPPGSPQNPRVMVDGAFKVPILRNVELTGPYFHNGGQRTLREVIEFYRRQGDFSDVNIAHLDSPMAAIDIRLPDFAGRDLDVDRLIKFLLTLTDERVRYEMAPFDHPQLFVPNGHPGDSTAITEFDLINGVKQAKDILLEIPAVGRSGRQAAGQGPVQGFLTSGAIQSVQINLRPGWNILSTPIKLHTSVDTWGEFSTYNGLNFQAAYRWDGTAFQFIDASYVLQPLDAIYVKMNTEAAVELIPFDGVSAPPSRTLNAGWNLVGSAFLQSEMSVKDAFASAFFVPNNVPNTLPLWGYTQIVSPTSNVFDWVYVRDSAVIPNMQIGEGYWVSMVNAGQVGGFTSTPLIRPR